MTLDVLRLSGWLKFFAFCRVERRACGAGRDAGCKARELRRGAAAAQAARTRRTQLEGWAQSTRGERTSNMPPMTVTLDVSKVSCWLNAVAPCRVGRRACDEGRGAGRKARELGRGPVGGHKRRARGGLEWRVGGRGHAWLAHIEHEAHVRDAGRVEVQRLVECLRRLPSRKEGMRCRARCGVGAGGHKRCEERDG